MKKLFLILGIVLISISFISCAREAPEPEAPPVEEEMTNIPKPEDMILDPAAWKEKFPKIYDTFMMTSEMNDDKIEDSDLGGEHPIDYLKKYPNITILYEGIGFSKEYYAPRGHFYSLEDVINISRPKPGASCIACKSAEYEKLYVENGNDLFAMDFQETVQDVKFGITCYNCHRNTPGEGIQPTTPQFNNAYEKLGRELEPGTQACAQCHVEYYFDKESQEVILPWDNGIEVDQIEAYYDEIGFTDWEHPRTGTHLIKVQHPEFEMYSGSVHDSMGVSCADCHMPPVTENGEKYKSHWVTSPLKEPQDTCGRCHREETEDIVVSVEKTQKEIDSMEVEVSDMLVKMTKDFATAIEERKLDDDTLSKLRELHRKAQYRWDFVFVENSTGFHNDTKARRTLEDAKGYVQEALDILDSL